MDYNYSKKKLKQLKKLGFTDNQIDNLRLDEIGEYLLDYNCSRLSKDTGKTIKYAQKPNNTFGIYLVTATGRLCEFYVTSDMVALHYQSALYQVEQELRTRFYCVV